MGRLGVRLPIPPPPPPHSVEVLKGRLPDPRDVLKYRSC